MTSETNARVDRGARVYLHALLMLVASRVLVALAMAFAARFVTPSIHAAGEQNIPWYQYLLRWDAGWYLQIVRDGYSTTGNELGQQSINFNPVYPVICKGLTFLGLSPAISLIVVANLMFLIGVPLLVKLIKDEYGDEVGLGAIAALCFFPSSVFFTAGYTESLALALIAGTFLLLKRKAYLWASVLVGLAVGTRLLSLVLIPPLVWAIWRSQSETTKRKIVTTAVSLILATSGVWLYMIYLWAAFNSPQSILTTKRAWHGAGSPNEFWRLLTLQPFLDLGDIWRDGPIPETIATWIFLAFAVLLVIFRKMLSAPYVIYSAGALLMPYFLAADNRGFGSFTRYVMLIFPIFIVFGTLFRRHPWIGYSSIGLFAGLLFLHSAFFAQAYWAG